MKKYELITEDTIGVDNSTLYRIRALRDFGNVKAGDLGGFVESEANLSQVGDCWIYDEAKVYGVARVCGNAQVCKNASVGGSARIAGNAWVHGNAYITNGDAVVWFSGVGSACGTLTVYCSRAGLMATRGCFAGTLDEFSAANAARPFSLSSARWTREYELLIEMARLKLADAQSKISGEAER